MRGIFGVPNDRSYGDAGISQLRRKQLVVFRDAAGFRASDEADHTLRASLLFAKGLVARAIAFITMRTFMLTLCLIMVTPLAAPAGEAQSEAAFIKIPSSAGASATSRVLDSVYHYPGTPGDHRLAIYMRDQLQRDGLRAWIESFPATVYTPRVLQTAVAFVARGDVRLA